VVSLGSLMAVPRFGRPNGRTRRPREGRIFQRKAVDEKKRSEREKEEESSRLFRLGNQIKSRDNGNRFLRKKSPRRCPRFDFSLDFFHGSRGTDTYTGIRGLSYRRLRRVNIQFLINTARSLNAVTARGENLLRVKRESRSRLRSGASARRKCKHASVRSTVCPTNALLVPLNSANYARP